MTESRQPNRHDIIPALLMEEIGLPELADIDTVRFATLALPAALAGMADGDIKPVYAERLTGQDAEMFGETEPEQGTFTQAIRRAAIEAGPGGGQIWILQDFLAGEINDPESPLHQQHSPRFASLVGHYLTLGDQAFSLPRPPQLMIEYGACMESRAQVDAQLVSLERGMRPYIYAPVSRTHFANKSIMETYNRTELAQILREHDGLDLKQLMMERRYFVGREDGEDSATQEFIQGNEEAGQPVGVADVILALSAQHTTHALLEAAVRRSHTLLREGGALVIRGMVQPIAHEVGIDDIAHWALTSGFEEQNSVFMGGKLNSLARNLMAWDTAGDEFITGILVK